MFDVGALEEKYIRYGHREPYRSIAHDVPYALCSYAALKGALKEDVNQSALLARNKKGKKALLRNLIL